LRFLGVFTIEVSQSFVKSQNIDGRAPGYWIGDSQAQSLPVATTF